MSPEGPSGSVAVKVCGLTTPEDVPACVRAGVWGIGVVFAANSPRRVDAAQAARVVAVVPASIARVGVFVGASAREMADTAALVGLSHIQVHGDADPEEARRMSGLPVIQGIAMEGPAALERARASAADLVLLDAAVAGMHGGTGTAFDWSLLEEDALGRPFALAGGLRPDNIGAALARLSPVLVDVSSGVEASPGRKDPDRVAAFAAAVADAARAAA
jgi:phosphoribosylanthranilate isomerase